MAFVCWKKLTNKQQTYGEQLLGKSFLNKLLNKQKSDEHREADFDMTFNPDNMIQGFMEAKKSCQLIRALLVWKDSWGEIILAL